MITENEIKKDYVSNKEAAIMLNVNESRIRQMLSSDRLPGSFKFADVWLIPRESVNNYTRHKPGKKPGQAKKNSQLEELLKENERLRELLKEFTNNENIGKIEDSAE